MIRTADLLVLWARAAGRCSFPTCKVALTMDGEDGGKAVPVGEAAHIVARRPRGPRGRTSFPAARRDRYENLILLCPTHHRMIDKKPWPLEAEELRAIKAEHEAWVAAVTELGQRVVPWTLIVQDPERRIDLAQARRGLPAGMQGEGLLELRGEAEFGDWESAAAHEWREVERVVMRTPADRRRFAVFSMGRIPLAVQLGYVLGDWTRAMLFHYDRDRGSWEWDPEAEPGPAVRVSAARRSEGANGRVSDANVLVSLSARVDTRDVPAAGTEIEIAAAEPSVRWLRRPEQITELARAYAEALAEARERRCRRVHLYYAGPAAGAVAFGRAYNPRMNPALHLYEYRRGARPCYEAVVQLNQGVE